MKALLLLLATAAAAPAEEAIPKSFDRARYAETVGKSPFVLETKVEAPKEPDRASPFANLFLRGITKDATGKDLIILQRLGEERAIRLIGSDPGEDQLFVKSVKNGGNFRETRVTLGKGLEFGEVGFKEDSLTAPPAAPGAKGPGGLPMPMSNPSAPKTNPPFPGTRPGSPMTPPTATPTIPRPTVAVPTPSAIPQSAGATRPRVRVINN